MFGNNLQCRLHWKVCCGYLRRECPRRRILQRSVNSYPRTCPSTTWISTSNHGWMIVLTQPVCAAGLDNLELTITWSQSGLDLKVELAPPWNGAPCGLWPNVDRAPMWIGPKVDWAQTFMGSQSGLGPAMNQVRGFVISPRGPCSKVVLRPELPTGETEIRRQIWL